MSQSTKGVILVGHGGIPKDYPQDLVTKLKRLEAQRRATGSSVSAEEEELDSKIRNWPRTPATDPYKYGLELLASHMKPLLDGAHFSLAFNEFCGPTLSQAVQSLVEAGAKDITIVTTMFTPGGSHSELEIPEEMGELRKQYPAIRLRYAWPYNLDYVCKMLIEHMQQFQQGES